METHRFRIELPQDLGEGVIHYCRAEAGSNSSLSKVLRTDFLGFIYNLGNTVQYNIGGEFLGTLCKRQFVLAFVPAGQCEFKLEEGEHCLACMEVSMRWLEKLIEMFPKFSEFVELSVQSHPHFSEPYRISPRVLTELRHTLDHEFDDSTGEMMMGVKYVLISLECLGLMGKIDAKELEIEKIRQAHDYLKKNIQFPLAVNALADRVNLSTRRLEKGFKKVYGQTIYKVLTAERLNKAVAYLRDSNLTVHEISSLVGYKNPDTFAATFKRNFGYSPVEMRKKADE